MITFRKNSASSYLAITLENKDSKEFVLLMNTKRSFKCIFNLSAYVPEILYLRRKERPIIFYLHTYKVENSKYGEQF